MTQNVSCFWTFTEGAAISNTEFWLLEPEFYVLRFVLCVVILVNNMNLDFNTIVRLQVRKPPEEPIKINSPGEKTLLVSP